MHLEEIVVVYSVGINIYQLCQYGKRSIKKGIIYYAPLEAEFIQAYLRLSASLKSSS